MTQAAVPPAVALYARGDPALCWLFDALARSRPLRCVTGADPMDLLRLPFGLGRFDPRRPLPVPLVPWGRPWRAGFHGPLLRRIARGAHAIVLTRPNQAALLPHLGDLRRIYYAVDDYGAYGRDWGRQEGELLAGVHQIVAVSSALAQALRRRHPLPEGRVTVSANGVPAAWIPPLCPAGPSPLPDGLDLPRPVAGVLGRVSSRIRLDWLVAVVDRLPWLHWLFVGDTEEAELRPADRPHLRRLRNHPRCRFVGARPYHRLPSIAAGLDVAILPYSERSTNPCGSPMRLFLQLPFGTPILATPGCLQVAEFAPLAAILPSPEAIADALEDLRRQGFDDGMREARWAAARRHTWEARAERLDALLGDAVQPDPPR